MSHTVVRLGAVFMAAASVLPYLKSTSRWIRFFDFPRLQLLGIGCALLVANARWSRGRARTFLTAAIAVPVASQLHYVRRYTPLASRESLDASKDEPHVRVLISNVWMPNRNAAGLLDLIRQHDPDIILLMEPDHWWQQQLCELNRGYPHSLQCPLENTYGMLLYSRLPISDASVRFLLLDDVPSMVCRVHLPSGDSFRLYAVHPLPPGMTVDTTQRDAELVLVGREVKRSGEPAIVAGDLNDVAWSGTTRLFQKVSGLLDPRAGRGFYNTFHARLPLLRWPLDHLFHSPEFRLARIERLPSYGSDHFAILAELSFEPNGAHAQEPPKPEPEDHAEAKEKLQEAREEGLL
ncbi:MAG TPA: endonuclease/exonuclease/phosphatase family protein [Bryobacteraceae bacterium]|nr:endonuclease/exonuclease/phosphatase family protein [Bryobacteraceae bacterium]